MFLNACGAAAPFTPDLLPNLGIWLKADSLALSNGASVSSWPDSSGNSNNASQATGGSQPTFQTGVLNGKPTLRSNGSQFLGVSRGFQNESSVFVVFQKSTTAAGSALSNALNITTGNEGNPTFLWRDNAGNMAFTFYYGIGNDPVQTLLTSSFYLSSFTLSKLGSLAKIWINGSLKLTDSSYVPAAGGNNAAITPFGGYPGPMHGDIAEIIVYDAVLIDTDRQKVETYLNAKYALF